MQLESDILYGPPAFSNLVCIRDERVKQPMQGPLLAVARNTSIGSELHNDSIVEAMYARPSINMVDSLMTKAERRGQSGFQARTSLETKLCESDGSVPFASPLMQEGPVLAAEVSIEASKPQLAVRSVIRSRLKM
jgi:hypothetical protein